MFHQSSKQILLGIFVALLLITVPAYAVEIFKISNYGGAHQLWFEAEDFDERDPPTEEYYPVVDKASAFGGKAITRIKLPGGMIRWTFDISKAGGKGGTWWFWGRIINPNDKSDLMLVEGDPGDPVIPTGPPYPGGPIIGPPWTPPEPFVNADDRIFEEKVGALPDTWGWGLSKSQRATHMEGHTKELQDGQNTMYIFHGQGVEVFWDVFMWTDSNDYVPADEDYQNATTMIVSHGPAYKPSPANEATYVPRDVTLSWEPGWYADKHDVYLGTVFDDVNEADTTNPLGVLASQNQDANTYDPAGVLDLGQTYYWRVDEVNAPPDYTVYKGDVWQFTVEPFAYPLAGENITATASSQFNENTGPEKTIDGSGLDENDLHSTNEAGIWVSSVTGPQPTWIQYEFDRVYKLHQMWVWNCNQANEPVVGFGIKDATIEYSVDGANWATLDTTHEFTRAPGTPGYAANTTVDLSGVVAKYIKITADSSWGGVEPQYGLSEVRFLYIPVLAREPNPDSGATDMDVDMTLSWRAGREAALHDVYLSTDEQAVIDETISPVSIPADSSYTNYNTGPLELGKNYWKINEVNEAETPATWQGDVWNFTTREFLVVDDIEDYNDFEPDRIYDTWIDGWNVPENGAIVGDPVWGAPEQTIVHSGKQSMPLNYDNTTAGYSEATANIADLAIGQNWTEHGIQTLVLYFHGTGGNTGQLYVKLNNSKVVYDGDAADIAKPRWKQWNIDLASFGVNLQNVTKLSIGIDGSGAKGTLYLDDICLYRLAPEVVVPSEEIWIEAESANTITYPMYIGDDPVASGSKYIGTTNQVGDSSDNPPAPAGTATYTFTVAGGTYKISCRIIIPSDDSFWVRIPGATTQTTNDASGWVKWADPPNSNNWYWHDVFSDSDPGNPTVQFTMPAGTYTLEIAYREDGALLDVIVISKID